LRGNRAVKPLDATLQQKALLLSTQCSADYATGGTP
jgi:hypothetical protein